MKTPIVTVMLEVSLLGAIVWGAIGMYNTSVQRETMVALGGTIIQQEAQISQAQKDYTLLKGYYDQLESYYDQLQQYYAQSQLEVANLGQEVASLEQQVLNLGVEVNGLEQETKNLKQEAASQKTYYERQIDLYEDKAERAKFTFYYVSLMEQRYGVDDLQDYLHRGEWKEDTYVEGKFDCSQMSAYLECKLENEGYHTVIVTGESPDGSGRHAWLLVEASEGKYMPVEATAYSIVYWSSPYFDNYFEYEYQFETIQEALSYSPTEFNWWE
ncbi:MAG TPA: hypothetical protein VMW00_01600 [Dehalococcoidales bacterium]|nr:hypothetical protein [Dehalococcoidales bacterium]